jgi:DNA-binding MarR family transcriptional regulator
MPDAAPRASPLFLRESEIRRGLELLFFGYSSLLIGPDRLLATHDLGRAHHRALYFIARRPDLTVSDLLRLLGITKQSLSRVLKDLQAKDLVRQRQGRVDRRQRLLTLTDAGVRLEHELYRELQARMSAAYLRAGQQAVAGFWEVLSGLIPPEDLAIVRTLQEVQG